MTSLHLRRLAICWSLLLLLICLPTDASTFFTADSKIGKNLLSNAINIKRGSHETRRLEDAFVENYVAQYSIIYEGCHNDTSWGEDNYRMVGLARFKLCPSENCTSSGCASEYAGEYVVELQTFVDSYLESKMEAKEYECEMMRETCGCDDDDNGNCAYNCYVNYGFDMSDCDDDDDNDEMELGECGRFEYEDDDDDNQRLLEEEEEEEGIFMGPYCAHNGKHIRVSLFVDEDCTMEYPGGGSQYYRNITGEKIPYHQSSIVDRECVSCKENRQEEQNGNDGEDEDDVIAFCEETYNMAAKCEEYMPYLYGFYPDTSACDVISKLKSINQGYVYGSDSDDDDSSGAGSNSEYSKFDFRSWPKSLDTVPDDFYLIVAGFLGFCTVIIIIFVLSTPSSSQKDYAVSTGPITPPRDDPSTDYEKYSPGTLFYTTSDGGGRR